MIKTIQPLLKEIKDFFIDEDFPKIFKKIVILLVGLFALIKLYYWVCGNLQQICKQSNSNEWYCVCNKPTISKQLANLQNSQQAAPWKVTLHHTKTVGQVKIKPKIKFDKTYKGKVYLSIFNINLSSSTIIINVNNYEINKNDNFDLAWTVNLTAGPNLLKIIITDQPIYWPTIFSTTGVNLINSLKMNVKFWTADSL
jgi:hypothetical protein